MTWRAPKSDGGSLITGYVIERREGSRTTWTKVGETSSETRKYKATRLTEGTEYAFRVAAENSIGVGEFATIDKPVKADVSFGESLRTDYLGFKSFPLIRLRLYSSTYKWIMIVHVFLRSSLHKMQVL